MSLLRIVDVYTRMNDPEAVHVRDTVRSHVNEQQTLHEPKGMEVEDVRPGHRFASVVPWNARIH